MGEGCACKWGSNYLTAPGILQIEYAATDPLFSIPDAREEGP